MKKDFYKNNRGNIAIIVAISLTVLIGILAIIIDGGWLYASKNKWQNGVEAAAMAGAFAMCDDDFEAVARQIAQENGLPSTEMEGLIILQGFYDEKDQYDDFPVYKDFIDENHANFPDDEYNNAVMVSLNANVSTFLAGIFGRDEVQVSASAVVYLQRYGMLALGEEDGDGIFILNSYKILKNGQPQLENGNIHANGDIIFNNGNPGINPADVTVSACGTVSGYDEGISDAAPVHIAPVDVYLEKLYGMATAIFTISDFPPVPSVPDTCDGIENEYGLYATCFPGITGIIKRKFFPKPINHEGGIYYFDLDDQSSFEVYINRGTDTTNMTVASNQSIKLIHGADAGGHAHCGNPGNEVRIISKKDITIFSDNSMHFRGTVVWAGNKVIYWLGGSHTFLGSQNIRMIADRSIEMDTHSWAPFMVEREFNFNFGPPCPPSVVRLGKLEPTGG